MLWKTLLRHVGLWAIFCVPGLSQTAAAWSPGAGQFRIHMVGHAHIDPVWLWPWPEGLSVVHSTFQSAIDRMQETPDFKFAASSAQFYEWISESDPDLLSQIRHRVEEGRWGLVGGWWVEPDVNMPSGEALIRQGLYGQLTLRRLLGRTSKVAFNPDSFGHPGTLPQILKLQEMTNYVFMRPAPEEKSLPADLFWWESPDGSKVLTYRIPVSYNDDKDVRQRVQYVVNRPEPLRELMAFYGAGDHGGGATRQNITSIHSLQAEANAPKLVFSTPEQYFEKIRSLDLQNVPVLKDDLQHHSVGCYTAESEMKKGNRAAEIALVSAEKLAALGSFVWNSNYPQAELTTAWKKVLFLQFHDSLAGTALPEHYATTAREGHGYAESVAHSAMYQAAEKLAWQIPATDSDSQYLVAFNLQASPVHANLEYDLEWNTDSPALVEDERGNALPHQWVQASTEVVERKRLILQADLPAFGYRQIRIRKGGTTALSPDIRASGTSLENKHLLLTFREDGSVNLLDKDSDSQVFTPEGARAVVLDDPSDTWSHDVRAYDKQLGFFSHAHWDLIERGPLRVRMRVRSTYGQSNLVTDWILYQDSRTPELRVTIDWHEHRRMMKFSFPLRVDHPTATYEVPYGNIVRAVNGDENPGQRWIDVSAQESHGQSGFAVINDAKYGYSVNNSDLRVSIVRGAAYAHHRPQVLDPTIDHLWQDQGVQSFRMLLVPHRGTWQDSNLPRMAEEFTSPFPMLYQGIHSGNRPASDSFLSVDAANIVVSAMKRSEEGSDLIVRCFETQGRPVRASINFTGLKQSWVGTFRPSEIKTLRIARNTPQIQEVDALER